MPGPAVTFHKKCGSASRRSLGVRVLNLGNVGAPPAASLAPLLSPQLLSRVLSLRVARSRLSPGGRRHAVDRILGRCQRSHSEGRPLGTAAMLAPAAQVAQGQLSSAHCGKFEHVRRPRPALPSLSRPRNPAANFHYDFFKHTEAAMKESAYPKAFAYLILPMPIRLKI